jgi:hypothetical protein
VHVVDRKTFELTRFSQQYEMRAAYPIGRRWCFVTELSVALVDLDLLSVVDEVNDFDDVILKWQWDGSRLNIEDFQGQQYAFTVSPNDFRLTPIRDD